MPARFSTLALPALLAALVGMAGAPGGAQTAGGLCDTAAAGAACGAGGQSGESVRARLQRVQGMAGAGTGQLGTDSCRWANDGECDDPRFYGTGACAPGTDASDCRLIAAGGNDSCEWAADGECDEPGIGTGLCGEATDASDCRAAWPLRHRDNTCDTAFNGICEEEGMGTGTCRANSDTADCLGRARPATMRDHYFGHDDRNLVDVSRMPWRAVGLLLFTDGACTGTLVGPRTVITAAHCLRDEAGELLKPLYFRAGARGETELGRAGAGALRVAPDYADAAAPPGKGNGNDWAIVTLDRDLGREVGHVGLHVLDDDDLAEIAGGGLEVSQAGYSWDTGANPSGHIGCRIVAAYPDGSVLHTCDTTQGDSGSPLMRRSDAGWELVAVDSQFFQAQPQTGDFASSHLAVDMRALDDVLREMGLLE